MQPLPTKPKDQALILSLLLAVTAAGGLLRTYQTHLYELMQGCDRIWLAYSHNCHTNPQNLIPAAQAGKAHWVKRRVFLGVEIHLYHMP